MQQEICLSLSQSVAFLKKKHYKVDTSFSVRL